MASTRHAVPAVARGAVGGLAAWLGGYLVVSVLYGDRIENWIGSDLLEFLTGESVTWKFVGWLFFNAHYVSVRVPGPFGDSARNFVTDSGEQGAVLLLALPPVLLVLAGLGAAWGRSPTLAAGTRNGALVALGYLPLSALGVSLFEISLLGRTAGPATDAAVLFAGLVYPVAFGALGGLVAGALASRSAGEYTGGQKP